MKILTYIKLLYNKRILIDNFISLKDDFNNDYEIYKKGNDKEFYKIIEKLKIKFSLFETQSITK